MQLGLKASTDERQIADRLQYHPDVFEFHLTADDFTTAGWAHLQQVVALVQQSVPRVVLHHPMKWQGWRCELCVNEDAHPELYRFVMDSSRRLVDFARATGTVALIHGGYNQKPGEPDLVGDWPNLKVAQTVVLGRLSELASRARGHVVFENSMLATFQYGHPDFERELLALDLPLAYDVSHAFIVLHGDNDALIASLRHLAPAVRHYHLVDSMGQTHDSLTLGTGLIDWARVLPELNPDASRIYEINLANQWDCAEMLASHRYLQTVAARID